MTNQSASEYGGSMTAHQLRIHLLGTLDVSCMAEKEAHVRITAAKPRQVLALLAANAGAVVSTEKLVDELWPCGPPNTVRTIVQTYVYQLRKLFSNSFGRACGADLLATHPGGYVLTAPRDDVDIFRFQHLMERGRQALRRSQPAAADLLHQALNIWKGPMPADLAAGPSLHGLSVYLEEQRLEALSLRIEADLANGLHRELVGELRSLVTTHRLHELFHIQLMTALHRSGRRGEALTAYTQLRCILNDELGLDPSPLAQQTQHEVLVNSPIMDKRNFSPVSSIDR